MQVSYVFMMLRPALRFADATASTRRLCGALLGCSHSTASAFLRHCETIPFFA